MKIKNVGRLAFSILICNLAGIIGSIFTSTSTNWYLSLSKPWFNPPSWLFAPAWTTLYILMGISLYLIWKKGLSKRKVKIAISVFVVQLFLNSTWTFAFFGAQNALLGFINIIAMWIAIVITIERFYRVSKRAAWLLIPYIVWVSFALILNYSLWALN